MPPTTKRRTPTTTKPPSLLSFLISLDTTLSRHLHSTFLPLVPRSLLRVLEISGDGRLWFPIPLVVLLLSLPAPVPLLLGLLLDLLFVGLLKHLVRRPRPVYNPAMRVAVALDHWSFPSGHSSRVFFVAAFLRLFVEKGEGFGGLDLVVSVWAVATSASRVLLGRHFVLDVVAGACLGVFEVYVLDSTMSHNEVWKHRVLQTSLLSGFYHITG